MSSDQPSPQFHIEKLRRDHDLPPFDCGNPTALAAGAVRKHESPERIAKGLANHPVGVILLARLAIDVTEQRKGLGKALLWP